MCSIDKTLTPTENILRRNTKNLFTSSKCIIKIESSKHIENTYNTYASVLLLVENFLFPFITSQHL